MIFYVRHGETVWNRAQRLQGRLDSPLTEHGLALAGAYGSWLAAAVEGRTKVAIHTSPLDRAHRTARVIATAIGLGEGAVRADPLLVEQDVGDWSGLSWVEIERDFGQTRACLRDWDYRPPGGETRREMLGRAARFLAAPRDEAVSIVVAHGGLSRAIRAAYLGLADSALKDLPTHTHGRLYRLADGRVDELVVDPRAPAPEQLLG